MYNHFKLNNQKKRKREQKNTPIACESCRRRKVKCSGAHPCDKCSQKNLECTYDSKRLKRAEAIEQLQHEKDKVSYWKTKYEELLNSSTSSSSELFETLSPIQELEEIGPLVGSSYIYKSRHTMQNCLIRYQNQLSGLFTWHKTDWNSEVSNFRYWEILLTQPCEIGKLPLDEMEKLLDCAVVFSLGSLTGGCVDLFCELERKINFLLDKLSKHVNLGPMAERRVSSLVMWGCCLLLKGTLRDWNWIADAYHVLFLNEKSVSPAAAHVVYTMMLEYKNETSLDRLYFLQKARELESKVSVTSTTILCLHAVSPLRISQIPSELEYNELWYLYNEVVRKLDLAPKDDNHNVLKAIAMATKAFFFYKFGHFEAANSLAAESIQLAKRCEWGDSYACFLLAFALPLVIEVFKLTNSKTKMKHALEVIQCKSSSDTRYSLFCHVIDLSTASYKLPLPINVVTPLTGDEEVLYQNLYPPQYLFPLKSNNLLLGDLVPAEVDNYLFESVYQNM